MSPTRTGSGTQAKRKPPPFKPPRPQKPNNSTAAKPATKRSTNASAKITKPMTSKNAKAAAGKAFGMKKKAEAIQRREDRSRATTSESLDDDEDEEDDDDDASSSDDHSVDDVESDESPAATRRPAASKSAPPNSYNAQLEENKPPPIPPKLLTRLLYESFEDKDMKIGREAMNVVGKYLETFVREAIARAAFERQDSDRAGGGLEDGFLQVEDLEKLAPQLLLDF